jgi:centrosomal protein CEP19
MTVINIDLYNPLEQEYGEEEEEEDDYGNEDEYDEEDYEQLYEKMGYNNLDLNKMTTEEIKKHKLLMDQVYNKNIKRPGDPGF